MPPRDGTIRAPQYAFGRPHRGRRRILRNQSRYLKSGSVVVQSIDEDHAQRRQHEGHMDYHVPHEFVVIDLGDIDDALFCRVSRRGFRSNPVQQPLVNGAAGKSEPKERCAQRSRRVCRSACPGAFAGQPFAPGEYYGLADPGQSRVVVPGLFWTSSRIVRGRFPPLLNR